MNRSTGSQNTSRNDGSKKGSRPLQTGVSHALATGVLRCQCGWAKTGKNSSSHHEKRSMRQTRCMGNSRLEKSSEKLYTTLSEENMMESSSTSTNHISMRSSSSLQQQDKSSLVFPRCSMSGSTQVLCHMLRCIIRLKTKKRCKRASQRTSSRNMSDSCEPGFM